MGAYAPGEHKTLDEWYAPGTNGATPVFTIPPKIGDPHFRVANFIGRPARPDPVTGVTQCTCSIRLHAGAYHALIKLTATLWPRSFPRNQMRLSPGRTGAPHHRELPDESSRLIMAC